MKLRVKKLLTLKVKKKLRLRIKKRVILKVKPKQRFKLRIIRLCKLGKELTAELEASLSPKACRLHVKRSMKPRSKSSGARKCVDCGIRCFDVKVGWSETWTPSDLPSLCRNCEVSRFMKTRVEAEKEAERRLAFIKGNGPHWDGGSVFTGHARYKRKSVKLRLVKKKLKLRVKR